MPLIGSRLESFLNARGVDYQIIPHRIDYSAQQTAQNTGTAGHQFAKSVLLAIDGRLTLAVLPADSLVAMSKVAQAFDAREVELAEEELLESVWPDCEIGAEPPFGQIYGVPVIMDAELCEGHQITFNAGTHDAAIRMNLIDFLKLLRPRVMDLEA